MAKTSGGKKCAGVLLGLGVAVGALSGCSSESIDEDACNGILNSQQAANNRAESAMNAGDFDAASEAVNEAKEFEAQFDEECK